MGWAGEGTGAPVSLSWVSRQRPFAAVSSRRAQRVASLSSCSSVSGGAESSSARRRYGRAFGASCPACHSAHRSIRQELGGGSMAPGICPSGAGSFRDACAGAGSDDTTGTELILRRSFIRSHFSAWSIAADILHRNSKSFPSVRTSGPAVRGPPRSVRVRVRMGCKDRKSGRRARKCHVNRIAYFFQRNNGYFEKSAIFYGKKFICGGKRGSSTRRETVFLNPRLSGPAGNSPFPSRTPPVGRCGPDPASRPPWSRCTRPRRSGGPPGRG